VQAAREPSSIPARVYLRPIGSPVTIGMSGLAVASLVEAGLDLRWISEGQTRYAGIVLLAMPFVLQLIASLFSYLARDGAGGAALGVLSTSWLAIALSQLTGPAGSRSGALGLALLAAGGVLALSAAVVSIGKPLLGAVFVLAGARFVLTGAFELGAGTGVREVAGVISLIVLALASYCVLAFELEGQRRHAVLPTFRRGRAHAAVAGDAAELVDGVLQDPGVRQMT
jgi:hypothetical protein